MNFGSRSEKVSRRIAQMEADLNLLQQESDTLTGRVDDPAVQRPLRQTRTRKLFPESLPRDEKRLLPTEPCCPECGGSLSYLGEDAAEQLELMRSAFRVMQKMAGWRWIITLPKTPYDWSVWGEKTGCSSARIMVVSAVRHCTVLSGRAN